MPQLRRDFEDAPHFFKIESCGTLHLSDKWCAAFLSVRESGAKQVARSWSIGMKKVLFGLCVLVWVGCMVGAWRSIVIDQCNDHTVCFCICVLSFSLVMMEVVKVVAEIQIKEVERESIKIDAAHDTESKEKEIARSEDELAKRREHEVRIASLNSKRECRVVVVKE